MNLNSEQDELFQLQGENRQLKDTIIALRQELEKQRIENDQKLSKG